MHRRELLRCFFCLSVICHNHGCGARFLPPCVVSTLGLRFHILEFFRMLSFSGGRSRLGFSFRAPDAHMRRGRSCIAPKQTICLFRIIDQGEFRKQPIECRDVPLRFGGNQIIDRLFCNVRNILSNECSFCTPPEQKSLAERGVLTPRPRIPSGVFLCRVLSQCSPGVFCTFRARDAIIEARKQIGGDAA